VLKVLNLY